MILLGLLAASLGCGGAGETPPGQVVPPATPGQQSTGPSTGPVSEDKAQVPASDLAILDQSKGEVRVFIDGIVGDSRVWGRVTGMADTALSDYKILVYVHADRWYVHPWAGQGEGKSWASLKSDQTWSLPTVKRAFLADKVAALVVAKEIDPPPATESIQHISSVAWVMVKGTGEV